MKLMQMVTVRNGLASPRRMATFGLTRRRSKFKMQKHSNSKALSLTKKTRLEKLLRLLWAPRNLQMRRILSFQRECRELKERATAKRKY